MKTYRFQAVILLASMLLSGNAIAGDNIWFGLKAGTLGYGAEASWRPLRWLDIRAGANQFDYDDSGSQAGVNYDATLGLETFYATANFRFPLSPFRISAGAYSNGNELVMTSTDTTALLLGDNQIPYTAADVGTLRGNASFDSLSPYIGAGFDFNLVGKLGLALDFGVLLQGDPIVTLSADGLLANDAGFLADLENERLELLNDVDNLKAYPVLALGLNFNF